MTYQVRQGSKSVGVRLGSPSAIYVKNFKGAPVMIAEKFANLSDVDVNNVKDKYVIVYDASSQKYMAVNPDQILVDSATSELTQPGLPVDFINTLDVDLDNKIDLDGGEF